jgi:hypothetical protein
MTVVLWSVPAFLLAETSVGPRASCEVGSQLPFADFRAAASKKRTGDESLRDPSPSEEVSL